MCPPERHNVSLTQSRDLCPHYHRGHVPAWDGIALCKSTGAPSKVGPFGWYLGYCDCICHSSTSNVSQHTELPPVISTVHEVDAKVMVVNSIKHLLVLLLATWCQLIVA